MFALVRELKDCSGGCGKKGDSLKRCSRCRTVAYCSVECQRKHWNQGHRQICAELVAITQEPSEKRKRELEEEEMVKALQAKLSDYGDKPDEVWSLGCKQIEQGDYETAAKTLVRALWLDNRLTAKDKQPLYPLLKKLIGGEDDSSYVPQRDPYAGILFAAMFVKNAVETCDLLTELMELYPDVGYLWIFRARVLTQIGRHRLHKGDLEGSQHDYVLQLEDVQKAAEMMGTDSITMKLELGYSNRDNGKVAESIKWYSDALKFMSSDHHHYPSAQTSLNTMLQAHMQGIGE